VVLLFLLLLYLLCDHCGLFWVLGSGSLVGFFVGFFLVLGKVGFFFPYFLLLLYLVFVVFICFEYTELLPGWLTSEALLTRC